MKHNRSAKQISLKCTKFKEETLSPSANSSKEFNFTDINLKYKTIKTAKYANSQKNLHLNLFSHYTPTISQFNIGEPKYLPIKTERHKDSKQFNTLTPCNRNLSTMQQPKKPKILNKVKHSLSFQEEFKMGKTLGKGRFGNVYLARHNITNAVFAAKQISLEKVSEKLIERLLSEIKIQMFLKHANCLEMYKYYKDNKNLYLILELGETSLFDILRQRKFFTEKQTAYYLKQTITALLYLHEHGIIHRDLKPENIVLVNNVVKLADFGWSIYTGKTKRTTFCGTLDYVSPEIVLGNQYDEMVDVWSVGVLCYELCTGHAPFESTKSRQETYRKIVNVDLKFPKHLSNEIRNFIKKILTKKPENRMTLEEALKHPWIQKYE